jgi:hypothetical protein
MVPREILSERAFSRADWEVSQLIKSSAAKMTSSSDLFAG